jgi:hypothetical protein
MPQLAVGSDAVRPEVMAAFDEAMAKFLAVLAFLRDK